MEKVIEHNGRELALRAVPQVIIYLRAATNHEPGASVERQRAACQRYLAERRPGLAHLVDSATRSPLRIDATVRIEDVEPDGEDAA